MYFFLTDNGETFFEHDFECRRDKGNNGVIGIEQSLWLNERIEVCAWEQENYVKSQLLMMS